MKKLFYSLILVIYFIGFPLHASAFGTSISGKSSINGGEEFTLTFSVTNATNLMGVQAKLNYDTAKLSIVSSGGLNDYVVTVGTNVVADRATGKTGSFGFATIKFKAKSAFIIGENTTVSLSSVTGSDGGDITGTGSSLKVSMVAPKSTNNNLSNLTIDGKQISGFSASKTSYSITVENNITTVVIGATSADSKATISGTGTKNLKIYQNTFNIIVTAESGAKKTYSVAIARKDSDGRTSKANTNNQLKSLTIKNVDFTFNPTTYTYDLEVDNEVTKLDITATTESSSATVKITNPDPLVLGLNLIKIEVTAEDKSTQTYTLNVNRDNNIPTVTEDNIYQLIESITSDVVNINVYDEPLILNSELLALLFEHKKDLPHTLHKVGFGFLVPIFFIYVGTTMDLNIIFSAEILSHSLLILAALVFVRVVSSYLAYSSHLNPTETFLLALGDSMPLTFIIAIATIAYEAALISKNEYLSLIVAGMLSGIIIMSLLKFLIAYLYEKKAV